MSNEGNIKIENSIEINNQILYGRKEIYKLVGT